MERVRDDWLAELRCYWTDAFGAIGQKLLPEMILVSRSLSNLHLCWCFVALLVLLLTPTPVGAFGFSLQFSFRGWLLPYHKLNESYRIRLRSSVTLNMPGPIQVEFWARILDEM